MIQNIYYLYINIVAEQVVGRSCEIGGIPLKVKMIRPNRSLPAPDGPLETKKLFVSNISSACDTTKLKSFLSKPAGCHVNKVEYAPRVGEAMVEFDTVPG